MPKLTTKAERKARARATGNDAVDAIASDKEDNDDDSAEETEEVRAQKWRAACQAPVTRHFFLLVEADGWKPVPPPKNPKIWLPSVSILMSAPRVEGSFWIHRRFLRVTPAGNALPWGETAILRKARIGQAHVTTATRARSSVG